MLKKLFKFDSNMFHCFNRDEESLFLFYWQSNPTKFKSFDDDLLTLVFALGLIGRPCYGCCSCSSDSSFQLRRFLSPCLQWLQH